MKDYEKYLEQLFERPFNLEKESIESEFLHVIRQAQQDAIMALINRFVAIGLLPDDIWSLLVKELDTYHLDETNEN